MTRKRSKGKQGYIQTKSQFHAKKQRLIQQSLIYDCIESFRNEKSSISQLKQLAYRKNGFLHDSIRQRVWPLLLNSNVNNIPSIMYKSLNQPHPDDEQFLRDIQRSYGHFDLHKNLKTSLRNKKQKQLFQLVNAIFNYTSTQHLHYYQGYHDVCTVFHVVLNETILFTVLKEATLKYFSIPMEKDFQHIMKINRYLFPIIQFHDLDLFKYIEQSQVEPYFALPWIITWFSHELIEIEKVKRLFDALLASHPYFILYMSAALVLHNKKKILECECEFAEMHQLLSSLPKFMEIERTLGTARIMAQTIPPEKLDALSSKFSSTKLDTTISKPSKLISFTSIPLRTTVSIMVNQILYVFILEILLLIDINSYIWYTGNANFKTDGIQHDTFHICHNIIKYTKLTQKIQIQRIICYFFSFPY